MGAEEAILAFGRFMNLFRRLTWLEKRLLVSKLYVQEAEYSHPLLPKEALRVLFVSDIHAGPYFSRAQEETLSRVIEAADADLILYGGDFGQKPQDGIAWLKRQRVQKPRYGSFCVPGNHDRISTEPFERLAAAAAKKGIRALQNTMASLPCGIDLFGADDFRTGKPDGDALRQTAAPGRFGLLLCHNPDALPDMLPPFYHLALCGHTHGGQVALFGRAILSSSIYRSRFLSGWKQLEGADILVSNGVGVSALPIRIGARPQVNLLTLRQGETGRRTLRETEAQVWLQEKETK